MFSAHPQSRSVSYFILFSHHSGLRERRGRSPALQLDSRRFLAPDSIFQLPRRPSICMCVNIRKGEVEGRPLTKRLLTQSSTLADARSHLSFVREEGRKEGSSVVRRPGKLGCHTGGLVCPFCVLAPSPARGSRSLWRTRVACPASVRGYSEVEDGATPPGKLHGPGPRASRLATSGTLTRSS